MRGDTVFDPIYWRTWEETLTVDYSTWLASLPKFFYLSKGSFLLILVASLLVLCFFTQRLPEPYRFRMEKIQGLVIIVIIAAWAVGALWLSRFNGEDSPPLVGGEESPIRVPSAFGCIV